jgi:gliding motility-associated-like protein
LTSNFAPGDDALGFTDQSGITGSFDSGSGILTLTGNATAAQYETALASLTFENSSEDPGAITKNIEIQLDDGINTSAAVSLSVTIVAVNDAPQISGSSADLAYRSLTGSIIIDDQITLSDPDDSDLIGATVSVAADYISGEDLLGFTDQNGITGSFNSVTGILNLSGTATVADYQTALRSVTYENTSPSPSAASKSFDFIVSDPLTTSSSFTRTIIVASNQVMASRIDTQADVGTSVTIDVISQASFTIGDVIATTITNAPTTGTAVVNPDGSITYTPNDDAEDGNIDVFSYELCNEFTSCGTNDINVAISNAPPEVSIPVTLVEPGTTATVPIAPGISDVNGNFDPNSVETVESPTSGLPVVIDSDLNLVIDYSGSGFQGADHVLIQVCDFSGACTQFDVVILVGEVNKVLVYNGVTPNNDGINEILKILDIEFFPENELFVYNKIGKLVYNVKNYNNESIAFSGIGDDGEELPDGTYYYVIILNSDNKQSGYFVLQR